MNTSSMRKICLLAICSVAAYGGGVAAIAGDREGGHDKMKMMDTNSDGKVSQAEHTAGANKMFQKMDANKDNRVTAAEMDAMHRGKDGTDEHGTNQRADNTAKQDADQQHGKDHAGKQGMSASEKMKHIDTNGDGVITAEEHSKGSQKMFSKMDKDGDGSLTAAEVRSGHKDRMSARDTE